MSGPRPEPWLRGPVAGVPRLLQPAAHALVMAREDVEAAVLGLSDAQIWESVSGLAPLGFHLRHLAGSTDRLLTYARGEPLTEEQRAALAGEKDIAAPGPSLAELLAGWRASVERALQQLSATPEAELVRPRAVGRAGLPSTVLGLLFHAAEHASRHTGQVVSTAKLIRNR